MASATRWQDDYRRLEADYERLREEAVYTLDTRIKAAGIKLHSLTSRVKTMTSLEAKAQRKGYTDPLTQTPDVVGVRVVVLFRSDMREVAEIVRSEFEVMDVSDTVAGADDPSTFGYMSQHFEACIPAVLTGPRYEGLSRIRFEVQVRTLLMDAWANVSHHLAYKGESSIPFELRRDFNALSGLFYVADTHFEMFFDQTKVVREQADRQLTEESSDIIPLNLDTLAAFLVQHFPDRVHAPRDNIGDLADELLEHGFQSIADVADMLTATEAAFTHHEERWPPYQKSGERFQDVGVVRVSLREANYPVKRKRRSV